MMVLQQKRKGVVMNKLSEVLQERRMSKLQLAIGAGVNPSDLYSAMSGKKPFYPSWKKRISIFLDIKESELFGVSGYDE